MNKYIAYCGLDCEKCDARIATVTGDDALRERTSKLWSELNQAEILPEAINCMGCRVEGVKFAYCEEMCSIRKCAQKKGYSTCGDCPEVKSCSDLAMIIGNNAEARANLCL